MRSYNGCLTGPTISVKPDARLKVTLDNQLEANNPPANWPANPDRSTPHCFNDTNLHTHGLHISPSGDQDNVLITVHPGDKPRVFNFQIPANHPSGTFWYHAHLHGSTAINVASGMAGVLIVRGSRPARAGVIDGSADIDTILHRKQLAQPLREHVLLFQQIESAALAVPAPRCRSPIRPLSNGSARRAAKAKYAATTTSLRSYPTRDPDMPASSIRRGSSQGAIRRSTASCSRCSRVPRRLSRQAKSVVCAWCMAATATLST